MYLAYDISTSTIGESLFDKNGKLLRLNHLKLKNDNHTDPELRFLTKGDTFRDYLRDNLKPYLALNETSINGIFIEEPLIASKTPNIAALLNKYNGICSYILYQEFGFMPDFITVDHARKTFCPELVRIKKGKAVISWPKDVDKKEYLWEKVNKMEPGIKWDYARTGSLKKECLDMSDAYVVGYSCLKIKGVIKT